MTLKRTEAFGKNITEAPQTIVHPGLAQLYAVPVAPGGYAFVVNQKVTIEPGQCFRVPMVLWNQGRSICRLRWVQEISEEEFKAALCPAVEEAVESSELEEQNETATEKKPAAKKAKKAAK